MKLENYGIGFIGNAPDISGVLAFLFVCLHGTDYKIMKE